MSSKMLPILVSLCLAGIFVLTAPRSAFPSDPGIFIDCDGDGFDDNAPDDDADGIPDEFERHKFISAPTAQLQVSQMFAGNDADAGMPDRPGRGESFGRRSFVTRSVCENRADFDDGFGYELGLGGGLAAGGGCAGGVCF